ncbi:MAG: lamin tail domain-containing protein [Rhodothermaceae bacterium]
MLHNAKKAFFICLTFIYTFGQSAQDLIITEILFNTGISNVEFVEIFNPSYTKSFDLAFLSFQYSTSNVESLSLRSGSQHLPPRTYAVILEKDYDFENNILGIDSAAVVLTTSDNAFGWSGMANSSDRKIVLLNSQDTLDSHTYTADNAKNFSDERVFLDKNTAENWKNSLTEFGTPGRKNSNAPLDYDLEVKFTDHFPEQPLYETPFTINYQITNKGTKDIQGVSLKISVDLNGDSVSQSNEILLQKFISNLKFDETVLGEALFNNIYHGKRIFIIEAENGKDQNQKNNLDFREIRIVKPVCKYNDIVVNEIMSAPQSEEPEWIELFNKSEQSINIQNWSFSDRNSSVIITNKEYIINPGEFLVIAKDDSFLDFYSGNIKSLICNFPSLNNSEDEIVIRDSLNLTIDSLTYYSEWHNNQRGKSIERIDAEINSNNYSNWKGSKKRGTPGIINSVSKKDYDIKIDSLFVNPNPPELNQTISLTAKVTNFGKNNCEYSLYLFHNSVCTDSLTQLTLQSDKTAEITFAKTSKLISPLEKYSVKLISKTDYDSTDNFFELEINAISSKGEILFSEIMFDPEESKPEWVEIYNNSDFPVNLKGWSFINYAEKSFQKSVINENVIIHPEEYFILTKNKTDFESGKNVIELNIGSLGNSTEKLSIKNYSNQISDSAFYSSDWKTLKTHSLERINFFNKNTWQNWHFSVDKNKSTPGKKNSVSDLSSYTDGDLLINEIMYNPGNDNAEFIELYNPGLFNIDIGGWIMAEGNNKTVLSAINSEISPGGFFVIANDSAIFNSFPELKNKIKISSSFSLSNSSETISIYDALGNFIDSVKYSSDWNNSNFTLTQNKSLEKIKADYHSDDPENWSTSVNIKGSTPMQKNSIILEKSENETSGISIFPNPFSPDSDGFEDLTEIKFNLEFPVSQIMLRVFDDKGRLVNTIENYSAVGSKGSIIYNGKDENGNPLGIGIYILLFEAYNTNNHTNVVFKKPFVVARKL